MAFDVNAFVASKKTAPKATGGGFDVNAYVASKATAQAAPGTKPSGFNVSSFVNQKGLPSGAKPDLGTLEGLAAQGKLLGLEEEVNAILDATPKMSFLQRLGSALGAFNPAEAILVGKEKGVATGLIEYPKDVLLGLASAVTGTDYIGDRRFFSDVVSEFGIKNSIAKFGIGLVGDVLLDPTTYFGGALARGALAGTRIGVEGALAGVGKVAPEIESATRLAAAAFKDAFGKTFQFGYGTTQGLADKYLEIQTKLTMAKEESVLRNLTQLGTDALSPSQQSELVYSMLSAKRAESAAGKGSEAGRSAAETVLDRISDPAVRKAIEEKSAFSRELARLAGIEDPFTIYFPSLKQESLDRFINATRQLRVGSEGYKKQFRDLLTNEELVLNPVEAFATREYQVMKDIIVKKELQDIVDQFGLPATAFENETAAKAAGYTPIFEKGSPIGFYKGEYKPAEEILRQIELQLTSNGVVSTPQVLEQSFIKVGQAIEYAREVGLKVAAKYGSKALGSATRGGVDTGGVLNLKAFTSETIAHELGHSFDTSLSGVINSKKVYKDELRELVKRTGLGGSEAYRASAVERFAEFTSLYIHNPGTAKKIAPNFTEHFETEMLQNEKIGDLVSRLGDFFQKVDKLPNIKTKLDAIDGGNYLQTAIRTAFPRKQFVGVRNIKPVGFVKEADKQFLDNLTGDKLVSIDMLAKATGFDAITALFKRSVTGLFAPFHIRNYVSGIIQNFEVLGVDALNPANIAAGQKIAWILAQGKKFPEGKVAFGGKEYDMPELLTRFQNRFGSSSSYIADIADATKGATFKVVNGKIVADETIKVSQTAGKGILSKESFKKTAKTAGLSQEGIPFRAARAVGNFVETQQKATAFITALNQGASVDEALKLAAAAGFDYRALTPFESKVLRRIIPFYSFTRKNIELQLKTLGTHPERINQVLALARNTGSLLGGDSTTAEERQNLPDFLRASLGIKIEDTPEGLKQYIASFGTPVEAFTDLISTNPILKAISMMNPLIKAPIEIGIGKDSFRQKDLQDVYDAREYKLAPQIIKDLLDITPVEKPILKKNAAGELEEVGTRTVYVADPVKLLIARSLFTARGVTYLDQMFGGDLSGFTQAIRLTTGIKPTQVDLEAQAGIKESQKKDALKDLLVRKGNLAEFSNVYIPKGRQ